ncbi:MAG: DUF5915 domain-containing protein, partial [Deltaproteobacteria bacterium]
ADLEIQDRIRIYCATDNAEAIAAITEWSDYIHSETLADSIARLDHASAGVKEGLIGDVQVPIWIEKVT